MKIQERVVVVTGGASGIGRALCYRFAKEGAKAIVVADRNIELANTVADEINGLAIGVDVAIESQIQRLVEQTTNAYGPIDLFCSNAGISVDGGAEVPDVDWQRIWQINFMSHVYAVRAVLPSMLARGQGYFLHTASAAGLLMQIGSAPYSVTKHAVVSLAEWLAVTHFASGIRVSCLCPQGVDTPMLDGVSGPIGDHLRATAMSPEDVADTVIAGLEDERFLILPHLQVAEYFQHKANDYDRWLRGMRRLQDQMRERM
jgi:NAD(P)-dependent dehydrogenase (short-subunit alcohol dehydrogenase family)